MNWAIRLARRAQGLPGPETWRLDSFLVPEIVPGEIRVEVSHVSIDPAMRGWIEPVAGYMEPVAIDETMRADAVGRVVASRAPGFTEGDWVSGWMGVQQIWAGDPVATRLTRIDTSLGPPERYLGALGLSGMTAYFGLTDIAPVRQGDQVLISGAAGAVGALAGQIARNLGASRVVGIAGGETKCRYLTDDLGFDAALDYKAEGLFRALRAAMPQGVDVMFDNVGGDALEYALRLIGRDARIAICGAISAYNDLRNLKGPPSYFNLVGQRARMQGFIVLDYEPRYAEARAQLAQWIGEGRLQAREHVEKGIERFADVFQMLFRGENFGKLVLQINDAAAIEG